MSSCSVRICRSRSDIIPRVNLGRSRGASSIATAAALSVAILIAATGSYIGEKMSAKGAAALADAREPAEQQEYIPLSDADGNGIPDWQDELTKGGITIATSSASSTISSDPASKIGGAIAQSLVNGYLSLKESDSYTPSRGEQLAGTIATNIHVSGIAKVHTSDELTIDQDDSEKRVLEYRSDMRAATAVLVDLEAEPEFSLFARFIATGDSAWLDKLSEATKNYRTAEENMLKVSVPASAAETHLRVVNATAKFAETLERLVRFANDPLATMALLRTYNEAEREFLLAFDALAKYYVREVSAN